ncbi:MAG: HNH endonuclease [Faecalibacterium sp.]
MTKIEAIFLILADHGGIANWQMIYNEIEKYYPNAKKSVAWQEGIRGVLYREIKRGGIKKIDTGIFALGDYDERSVLLDGKTEIHTEKQIVQTVRTMQSAFRKNLLKEVNCCPFTQITYKPLLVASHIKPWCFSDNLERIDAKNGFLFTPMYDKLFDSGLITFNDDKEILFSEQLPKQVITKLNIQEKVIKNLPIKGREDYLQFHRQNIFVR